MAEQSLVESAVGNVRSAVKVANRRLQKLQKELDGRRKSVEKDLRSRSRRLEQRTQREVARLVARAEKLPLVKQATSFYGGASQKLEASVESVLGALQIASRSEVERLDRKLNQMSRKLRELEKGQPEEA